MSAAPASIPAVMEASDAPIASDAGKLLGFAMMALGMFMSLLDIQIVASSLQQIGGSLSASVEETAWVQTSYLVAEIVMIPLSGFLSRLLSTRWLFAISAAGFTLTSVLCGSAWDIDSMIAFRAAQGFLGGAMIPTVFTAAFVLFPGKQRTIAAATIGIIATIAPTIGATLGGWITENWSWHWLFYVNLIPGSLIAVTVLAKVRYDRPNWALLRQADLFGIALMGTSLGCLQYLLEEGPRHDWLEDAVLCRAAWISALAGVAFVVRSLSITSPVVDLRAFGDRNFSFGCAASFVLGLGMFSAIYLVPYYLAEVRGFSSLEIGLAIASTGIFQVLSVPVAAFAARRIDLRILIGCGYAAFAFSMWMMTSITDDLGWRELLVPQAIRGFSIMFCILPSNVMALGALSVEELKLGSGLYNLMRNLGGAIGIAACGTIIHDRSNLHLQRLAEALSQRGSLVVGQRLTSRAMSVMGDATKAHLFTMKTLLQMAYRQALVLSVSDGFFLICLCFVAIALTAPLARYCPFEGSAPDAGH